MLLSEGAVPVGGEEDALHIGIAAAQGADFLLTWNFRHIKNAETKAAITQLVESCGYTCPQLCSPEDWEECQMINDPIVEEVRRYRKEHAARYGNDLKQIVEALREKERESTRVQLNPGPKLILKKIA